MNPNAAAIQRYLLNMYKNADWTEAEEDHSDYRCDEPVVVLAGCERSGSTLLRLMLDSHSQIVAGPITHLFMPVLIDIEQLATHYELGAEQLRHLHAVSGSRSEFIDKFRTVLLRRNGGSLWVDKTPRNVHRLAYILKHFPNAKFLHLIRDGRDTICSLRTHRKRILVNGDVQLSGIVMPLQVCIDRWCQAVNDGLRYTDHPNLMEVRYEALVTNTEATLRRVCAFLEVAFEPGLLTYYRIKGPGRDPRLFPYNREAMRPVFTHSIGRWKRELSTDELAIILPAIRFLQERLGYR